MIEINPYIKRLHPYIPVSQDIWQGKTVKVKADWNEEIFRNPVVEEEMIKFIKRGMYNYYPDVYATKLREVLSEFHGIEKDAISVFNGSDEALDVICRTFLRPKSKVIVRNPEYTNFYVFVESVGAKLNIYYQTDPFVLNEEKLYNLLVDEQPNMVYLSNPNNPAGFLYPLDYLLKIINRLNQTLFVIDEAYIHFAYKNENHIDDFLKKSVMFQNVIVVRTFSKLFSLAGLRIGYIVANKSLIHYLDKIRKAKNVSMISQVAAVKAIEEWDFYNNKRIEVINSRDTFIEELKKYEDYCTVYPSKANFVCVRFPLEKEKEFLRYLKANSIYVRDRSYLPQLSGVVRITIQGFKPAKILMEAIRKFVANNGDGNQ